MINKRAFICHRLPITLVCMLVTSCATAASYSIADGYGADRGGVCQALQKALTDGLVLDAGQPLCERRFQLSSKAKELGFVAINKTLVAKKDYPVLMRQVFPIMGAENLPQSEADRDEDEKIISQHMRADDLKIYSARFDVDNSGKVRDVYVFDITSCEIKDAYGDGSVTTAIKNDDGSINRFWGVRDATSGIPVIFNERTYFVKWNSLAGSVDKKMLAQLNVYKSGPYTGNLRKITPYYALPPASCIIYQAE